MYVTAGPVLAPTQRRFLLSMSVSAGFHIHASMWKMQLCSKTQNNSININALCITTKKKHVGCFYLHSGNVLVLFRLEETGAGDDAKCLHGGGGGLSEIWICFEITERCESGSRAGRAELVFRYFVSASACFGRSHLSAAHNMEHNSGGK